jgi:vanillin dehydrogenase
LHDDRKAASGASFDRLNPLTGAIASRAAAACAKDVACAAAAAAAFPAWSETGPAARRALLNKAADLLEGHSGEFAALMGAETGATAMWAGFNCMLGAGMLREAAAMTSQIAGEVIPSNVQGSFAMGYRQPVGVVLGIAPWNAPVILGVRAIAMPLACGNSVILKASEMCPATHRLIGSVLREAGFPPGVVNVLSNAPSDAGRVVEALIAHPAVRRVNFTGSSKVGKIVAKICAEHLKPVLLELGGKSPLLVLEDADIEAAVAAAAFGAFANQGQICMSTERIVVDQKIADVFVERFATKAKSLSVGDPREGNAVLGSLVDRSAAERVTSLVLDAVAKGARLVSGGSVTGTLINAHVLDHVTPSGLWPWSCAPRTKRRPCASPTIRPTDCRPPSLAAMSTAPSGWRGALRRASAISMDRPCTTRRRCPLAGSRPPATGVLTARLPSPSSPSCAGSPSSRATATIRSEAAEPTGVPCRKWPPLGCGGLPCELTGAGRAA